MIKIGKLLCAAAAILFLSSCEKVSNEMDRNYNSNYEIDYTLRKVLQYDPVNINGIDVSPYFDFFKTLKFKVVFENGKITAVEYDNGDIPFSPFPFNMPQGRTACVFDNSVSPNVLRLKESGDVVAVYRNGELYIPFVLDCKELSYEFRFRESAK